MDGRKVGYLHLERSVDGDRVVTDSTLKIRFARIHQPLDILNHVRESETARGRPLAFSAVTHLSDETSSLSGERIDNDNFRVTVKVGPRERVYRMSWPDGALLDNGMRQAIVAHGFEPGTRYVVRRFNASSQAVSRLDMQVIGPEAVELPGQVRRLVHLRQTRVDARSTQVTDLWVDARGEVMKLGMPLLGFRLELLACSRACALQPDQDVDVLKRAMVMLPRPLPEALRAMPLRFTVRVHPARDSPFIDTDMQRARRVGRDRWVIDTLAVRKGVLRAPVAADLAPNDWLQSDAPAIRAVAREAAGDAQGDARRMQRMTQFVRDYLSDEGASVGYASALEALRSRRGDCTEHAVLLAAMARAQRIPARVVTGLAYVGHYAGQDHVLVPHTWVQAWVDGAWREYDAAMPRHDHAHIAMDVGDGDPWKYFSGISALGGIQVLRVDPAANIGEDRPLVPSATPSGGGQGGNGR